MSARITDDTDPPPAFDAREAERHYRRYRAQCRRLGVKPQESAMVQIKGWVVAIAARQKPTTG